MPIKDEIKTYLRRDKVDVGIVVTLLSEVGYILALSIGLLIAGESMADHQRWYGGMFIAVVLLLRTFAKRKEQPTVTKAIIITFFATFIIFMIHLLRSDNLIIQ